MSKTTKFGMLSVKAGMDKNPAPTQADRIAGAKMNKKAYGGKAMRKNYAYGSTVRSPMNPDTSMSPKMNPMMPRTQQSGSKQGGMGSIMSAPSPMTNKMEGMMYGGKTKKKM